MSVSQPTILVKKSDGTSVRMTMEEFRIYQSKVQKSIKSDEQPVDDSKQTAVNNKQIIDNKTENPPARNASPASNALRSNAGWQSDAGGNNINQTTKPALPMKELVRPVPATTTPVKDVFVDEARAANKTQNTDNRTQITNPKLQAPNGKLQVTGYKLQDKKTETRFNGGQAKNWEQADNKPLLQEDVVGARKQEVIRTTLPDDRGGAFDVVIRNLKFPVRDELRPRLKSLIVSRVKDIRSDEQVSEYAMRAVENGGLGWSQDQVAELLQMIKQMNKTQNANNRTPASTAGRQIPNKVANDKIQTPNSDKQMTGDGLQATGYRLQATGEKPVLHDVVAPVEPAIEPKVGMGPMEEFASFQMIDFRRLGGAVQAGEVMRKKFETTRTESLIFYLRAVKAWQESPLYRQYQKVLTEAINQSRAIQESVAAIGWKWEEFSAINKLCNSL